MLFNFTGYHYMIGRVWIDINIQYTMGEILQLTNQNTLHCMIKIIPSTKS